MRYMPERCQGEGPALLLQEPTNLSAESGSTGDPADHGGGATWAGGTLVSQAPTTQAA